VIRSRNQNSFLAVATLGVYLGLILAGATPSVLAQAATAKQFNVKDEAGRKDDLDKKPNDDACAQLGSTAEEQLHDFGLDKYVAISLVNLVKESVTDFVIPGNKLSSEYGDNGLLRDLVPKSGNPNIRNSVAFQIEPQKSASTFRFTFTLESVSDAVAFANAVDYGFRFVRCSEKAPFYKVAYDRSLISHANGQVFVVTRLPRGSLDTLLASNAK
jgi:hypothetical protein